MFTNSFSSFTLPQPFVTGHDAAKHNKPHQREIKADNHHKPKHRLADDSYQPTRQQRITERQAVNSTMAVQSVASSVNKSAEIQVITNEGDVVTINISKSAETSKAAFSMEQGNTSINAYAESATYESEFSLSIEGDLNEEEQKSLTELINKMHKVSNKFFNGNVQSAFKHAQKIGLDTEQLASFSMDLNMQHSVQAVAAYQQTAMPEQSINTDMLKQASNFLSETKDFMADSIKALDSFVEPKQSFNDLLSGMGQSFDNFSDHREESSEKVPFLEMVEHLGNNYFRNHGSSR